MAFAEYTKCVKPSDFTDLSPEGTLGKVYLAGEIVSLISMVTLALLGFGTAAIINAIVLMTQIIIFLRWWLYGRLICLGDDSRNCAIIGKVMFKGSNPKKKGGDNDFTMNILLAPRDNYMDNIEKANFTPDLPQGHLYADHSDITALGRIYASEEHNKKYWQGLHVEFEGRGIYDLYVLALAMMVLLVAALFVPFPYSLILVLLAFLALLAKFIHGLFDNEDSPTLETPLDQDTNGSTIFKGAVVVMNGEWIYDAGHTIGKNEIHPIRSCIIVGVIEEGQTWSDLIFTDPNTGQELRYDHVADVETIRDHWCGAFKDAVDAEDGGSRDDVKNDWDLHPTVDGCREPVIIT
jgi:hypothetical protein